jgi:hypothetical protein
MIIMQTTEFIAKLKEVSELKQYLKDRYMIFQVEAKEHLAMKLGLHHTAFDKVTYKTWINICKRYNFN